MSSCCCCLAGTAACRTCSNNPFAETPPPVRTYTVSATNQVLFAGQKTNADRIRSMTDEELADFLFTNVGCIDCTMHGAGCSIDCEKWMLSWLKSPVEVDNG